MNIDDPAEISKLLHEMSSIMAVVPLDSREYQWMIPTLRDMEAFARGEYSLFKPLPEAALQAERQAKQAAKEAEKAERVQRTPPPKKEPEGTLAAAARALGKKMQTQVSEDDEGQISFDLFSAPVPEPQELPAAEAVPLPQEQASILVSSTAQPLDYDIIKAENPDSIVLYQVGSTFEIHGEDARLAASLLKLEPTPSVPDMSQITACGIPAHSLEQSVEMLREQHSVAIAPINPQTGERSVNILPPVDKAPTIREH